jgi:predicted DsbA family dithiol-disulfide isomerase
VNPDVWRKTRPTTSANAHIMIKAVELADGKRAAVDFALAVRKAFFVEARDISDLTFLHELVKKQSLDGNRIEQAISGGMAVASLLGDYQQANKQGIKGSPSYVVDNGRQTLYGNVGYRVLHANIEELLKSPADEANWC